MSRYIIYCSAYDKSFAWKQGIFVKKTNWVIINPNSTNIRHAIHKLRILGYLPNHCYSSYTECLLGIEKINYKLSNYNGFVIQYSEKEEGMIEQILQAEKDMEELRLLMDII